MNFRFLNIPVCIHPTFWIFLLFYTNIYRNLSIESIIVGIVLIFSLLVHEYGHALTALYFGASPIITLEAFGGNAQYNDYRMTSKQQFLITLNGPLLESILIVLPYFFLKSNVFENYYIRYFLYVTMRLNILWCLLNLIPISPLDGGHIIRYFLEKKFEQKGYRASIFIGLISVVLITPYLIYLGLFFFAILLVIFGFQNFQLLQKIRPSSRSNHFSNYVEAIKAISDNDFENAKVSLKTLLKSKNTQIKNLSIESLAKIYFLENDTQKSYELLMKADPQFLKEGKCLLCKLAFNRKNYEIISRYSRDIYEIEPTYETAILNSKAFAYLNQPDYSGAWLETASQFGNEYKEKIQDLLLDEIYDSVKNQEIFKEYVKKCSLEECAK